MNFSIPHDHKSTNLFISMKFIFWAFHSILIEYIFFHFFSFLSNILSIIFKDNADQEWNETMNQLFKQAEIFYLILIPILDYLTKRYLEKVNEILKIFN
jgi:succinate dehydrogenase/fumarate reductase cytochrome b subunit